MTEVTIDGHINDQLYLQIKGAPDHYPRGLNDLDTMRNGLFTTQVVAEEGSKDTMPLIVDVRVDPDLRRKGFGTALLKTCMERAEAERYPQLHVEEMTLSCMGLLRSVAGDDRIRYYQTSGWNIPDIRHPLSQDTAQTVLQRKGALHKKIAAYDDELATYYGKHFGGWSKAVREHRSAFITHAYATSGADSDWGVGAIIDLQDYKATGNSDEY